MSTTACGSNRSRRRTSTSAGRRIAPLPLTWLDVFTRTPLAGNGLAVVRDADGVTDAQMHAFARETRLAETSFVQSSDDPAADYRHRIWMVRGEIPFAGHPSLGTAVAVLRARGERAGTVVQQTVAGLQPIDVEMLDDRHARASMLQEPVRFGADLDPGEVLSLVGLDAADVDFALPAQIVSTGAPQVVVGVVADAVARARPPADAALAALLEPHEAVVLYIASVDPTTGSAHARSFYPGAEDPATGAGAGPLLALAARRLGVERLRVRQGVEMGRPSTLDASIEGDRVRVAGDVVVVLEGSLFLDV